MSSRNPDTEDAVTDQLIDAETAEISASALATSRETVAESEPAPPRRGRTSVPSYLMSAAGFLLWGWALPSIPTARESDLGLLFTASPAFALAVVAIVAAFFLAVRDRDHGAMTVALIGVIVVQRLTATLTTPVPIYTWTYKHLGVVDYIARNGALAQGTDVYHEWPGLFAATAWFTEVAGVDPVRLAHWFTPVVHLLVAVAIIGLASALGASLRVSLTAAFLASTLNWVGQDYFAPQAVAFILAISVLTALAGSRTSTTPAVLSVPLFAALVVTHQLTPYWLLGVAIVLVVLKSARPWWLPAVFAAIALAYLLPRLGVVQSYGLFNIPNPFANASSNVPTVGTEGRQGTMIVVRGLSVTLWVASLTAAFVQWRRGTGVRFPLAIVLTAFSLLMAQSYGGEAIFRVYLYALPGCVLLLAPLIVTAADISRVRLVTASVAVLLAVGASMQGSFGAWFVNVVRPDELDVAVRMLSQATPPSNITMAGPIWPERPTEHYVDFSRVNGRYDSPMVWAAGLVGSTFADPRDLQKVDDLMIGRRDVPNYLVISTQMKRYCDYYGIFPPGALDRLRELMLRSPNWRQIHDSPDVTVFVFRGEGSPTGPRVLTALR